MFTAASMDNHLRAFDSDTGRERWKYELPAGGQATPMTYRVDGRQYLVIAAGGHGKLGTSSVTTWLPSRCREVPSRISAPPIRWLASSTDDLDLDDQLLLAAARFVDTPAAPA